MSSKRNLWKDRAWRACSAMHNAEVCRTVEDMRRVILQARMELEAYFVQERNAADIASHNRHSDADREEDEIAALLAGDIECT